MSHPISVLRYECVNLKQENDVNRFQEAHVIIIFL